MPKPIKVSDESYNSYNIRVLTDGIGLARFKANPIMLFNHHRSFEGKTNDILPIGQFADIEAKDGALFATPVFDLEDKYAAKLAGKFDRGVIRSFSIGIHITEMMADGLDDRGNQLYVVTKCQLREISLVDIPSNENAVAFYDENEEPLELSAALALAAGPPSSKPSTMNYQFILGLLSLAEGADQNTVTTKINGLLKLQTENVTLKAENDELKATAKAVLDAQIVQLADDAEKAGKISAAEKAKYITLLELDFETTKSLLDAMPKRMTLKDVTKDLNDSIGKFEGKTFSQLSAENPDALAELKANNFEAFNDLYKAEFKKNFNK